jgi:hypothetical protein
VVTKETIANMRNRMARCRRLAKSINDIRTAAILRQMADEIEADIAMLERADRERAGQ